MLCYARLKVHLSICYIDILFFSLDIKDSLVGNLHFFPSATTFQCRQDWKRETVLKSLNQLPRLRVHDLNHKVTLVSGSHAMPLKQSFHASFKNMINMSQQILPNALTSLFPNKTNTTLPSFSKWSCHLLWLSIARRWL